MIKYLEQLMDRLEKEQGPGRKCGTHMYSILWDDVYVQYGTMSGSEYYVYIAPADKDEPEYEKHGISDLDEIYPEIQKGIKKVRDKK